MPVEMSDFAKQAYACFACLENKEIQIFPHTRVDGDAVGSACALASGFLRMGIHAKVMLDAPIPPRLYFMEIPEELYRIVTLENEESAKEAQGLAFAVDCAEAHRMGGCEALFAQAKTKLVIDHHVSVENSCENSYIDPKAASASELVYAFLRELEEMTGKKLLDQDNANWLMVGIQSDSGKFSYENTNPKTFRAAADLLELGANISDNAYHLFDESSKGKVLLQAQAMNAMQLFDQDKIAITKITMKMMEETQAPDGAADGIANILRDIDTVLAAFAVRECEDGTIRVNCRSKEGFDAAAFAQIMGGGGHHRASGFSGKDTDIDTFVREIVEKATTFLERQ